MIQVPCATSWTGERGWWHKAPELAFYKVGKGDRRAVFQIRTDRLEPDRQATVSKADWERGRRQSSHVRETLPYRLLSVSDSFAVYFDVTRAHVGMIMDESRYGKYGTNDEIPLAKELAPPMHLRNARAICVNPVPMTKHDTAQLDGRWTRVVAR